MPTDDAVARNVVDLAEADLTARESVDHNVAWTLIELAAFATEHDELADRRDALAQVEDEHAAQRDATAISRDVAAADRDRNRNKGTPGGTASVDRFLAAGDRDDSASDRVDARDDRQRARKDRDRAATARRRAADDREAALELEALSEHAEGEIASLWQAIETRQRIGQATGIWMERHDLTAERAFATIVQLSKKWNIKLSVVAAQIVSARQRRSTTGPADEPVIILPSARLAEPIPINRARSHDWLPDPAA